MIQNIRFYIAEENDPYRNLSAEKYLLDHVSEEECILYLWQNAHTVVIGRNQNPWAECRCALLAEEGGRLARRLSGGGAVYHDLGNLNFTFLCHTANYDLSRQLKVIQKACALAGIEASLSGRNDLLADGRKFSGNAFYNAKGRSYHHGTLLIDADIERMSRYLTPPKAKLQAKGVASVRSRVVNLKELSPALTAERMKEYMLEAFEEIYGLKAQPLPSIEPTTLAPLAEQFKSWNDLFGATPPCSLRCEQHFDWGNIQLNLTLEKGVIQAITAYTDAMDHTLPKQLEQTLVGRPFTAQAMQTALAPLPYANDLFDLLLQIL